MEKRENQSRTPDICLTRVLRRITKIEGRVVLTERHKKISQIKWSRLALSKMNKKRTIPSHITVKSQNTRDKGRIVIILEKPNHIHMYKNQNGIEFLNSSMVNLEDPRTKLSSL